MLIHQGHLVLELEIRHRPKSPNDHLRVAALDIVHQQAVERIHLDVADRLEYITRDLDPFVHREQWCFLGVHQDRDNDAVEQAGTARDDVDVPVGQRVEGSRIDGYGGHE